VSTPDNAELARLARDTLSRARSAALTIRGCRLGPDGDSVLGLHADNGWPVFSCELDSAVAAAATARQDAVLNVHGPADGPETVTVLLAGRLELVGRGWEDERPVGVVMLAPERVLVETATDGRPVVSQAVPAREYADAEPDVLTARAAQIAVHTNLVHGADLRGFVAVRTGLPVAEVAAAWLNQLDERGALIGWADITGAYTMTARFPRPARTAIELGLLLQEQLAASQPERAE
jgi:hypothetical protein